MGIVTELLIAATEIGIALLVLFPCPSLNPRIDFESADPFKAKFHINRSGIALTIELLQVATSGLHPVHRFPPNFQVITALEILSGTVQSSICITHKI